MLFPKILKGLKRFFDFLTGNDIRENEIKIANAFNILAQTQMKQSIHIIAIARLLFIKPETLLREINNAKSNTEYVKLLESIVNSPSFPNDAGDKGSQSNKTNQAN